MRLIIDLPKRVYDVTKTMGNVIDADNEIVAEAIANGTSIPDNATNGQVIQTLFKPNRVERANDDVIVANYDFNEEWWNSPYQKGGK